MNVPTTREPVVIIGAGPVGLAAAAQIAIRGLSFKIIEAGTSVGAAVSQWGHVRLFSPWRYCLDGASVQLLHQTGWTEPDLDALPTGNNLVEQYLQPLADHPAIAENLLLGSAVVGISRSGLDKVRSSGRESLPFEVVLDDGRSVLASAVIDSSGTWSQPNPAGGNGLPAHGENTSATHLTYGLPDVLGQERERFAGKRLLVVGSGHSAINSLLALLQLRAQDATTTISWAVRRRDMAGVYGGGEADGFPARGVLGNDVHNAVESGDIHLLAPFIIKSMEAKRGQVEVEGRDGAVITIDEVIVATGFRPDLEMLRELRLGLDPALEATAHLAPLIDPNVHSCGTVPPHGFKELTHPEPNFFIAGSKSYGRAPTFLLATGFEQVRSIVAHLAGDNAAAERVELVLPETGVCGGSGAAACCSTESNNACCGGAASDASSCCVADEVAKADGLVGCGCSTESGSSPSFISLVSL